MIGWYRRYKSSVFSRNIGMEVGLKKCEVTAYIEEGKAEKDRGLIQLVNGETILGLQPRDKAAMLGVKTKEYFLEEFT